MLWSRSASLMIRTRMSRAMATTILRTFSACSCSRVRYSMRSSLVSPSTMAPTSAPNPDSMGSRERSVSSTTSCSSADTSVVVSMPRSARMWATPSGWRMKGSPDFRSWPRWDWAAKSKARWTWRTSALGLYARPLRRRPSTPPSSWGPPGERKGRRERSLPRRSGALSSSTRVPPSVHCTGGVARRRDSVGDQGEEVEPRDLLPTLQERQLHQARDANDLAAEALHQLRGRLGRAPGGQDVVNDQDPLAGPERVAVDLEGLGAVLELVGLGLGLPRELPGLPDRHEPGPEVVRHGRGQDEAAGLDPHDLVDGPPAEVDHDHVDHRGERHLVGQQGRDVLERNPFLGEVGDVEDQGLVGMAEDHPAQRRAEPHREAQEGRSDRNRSGNGHDRRRETDAQKEHSDHGQVHGHDEVLHDEDRQHRRGLPVPHPSHIREELGHDPRGRDVRHAGEQDPRDRVPPQQEPRRQTRRRVQHQVHRTGNHPRAQPVDQFPARVFKAEQQEEKDHPDFRTDLHERLRGDHWDEAALPEGQPCQQVQRDRREPEPAGQTRQQREPEDDRSQLEQEQRVRHGYAARSRTERASIPLGVPTTSRVSPARNEKSGPGAGNASSPRITATMETPVRVRASVSPMVPSANGLFEGRGSQSIASPSTFWRCSSCSATLDPPRSSASVRLSSGSRAMISRHVSGSSRSYTSSSRRPVRWCTTTKREPRDVRNSYRNPRPGSRVSSTSPIYRRFRFDRGFFLGFRRTCWGCGAGLVATGASSRCSASSVTAARAGRAVSRRRARWRISVIFGPPSFSTTRRGAAVKIEEYELAATPTNKANAKSFRVSPPKNRSAAIGTSVVRLVFTDLMTTWFIVMFTAPA